MKTEKSIPIPNQDQLPPDERIPWEKCDGIEHVFYDEAGNVIFEEQITVKA